ncbi:hypothetical protein [Shimazuella alba]|uniref:Uncharacterized protein n=1 Tax=Shimazuella alba TaxID=2690964 RepID=A0A6I4VNS4_9BACL|nr:hypothetical protein [Shimazuella alba]MXQ52683.1 hypothetical protein [Shimazuella alba]
MSDRKNYEQWTAEEFVIKRDGLRTRIKNDIDWLDQVIEQEEKELAQLEVKTKSFLSYLFLRK